MLADQRGAVFVEFLVVIVPLWLAFLCIVQLALFAQADLIVKRAADAAARSASVVLTDDPEEYGGEPQMSVARGRVEIDDVVNSLRRLAAWSGLDDGSEASVGNSTLRLGRSRLDTIRLAASVPLIPLAPSSLLGGLHSVRSSLASKRSAANSSIHMRYALAVSFPQERDGKVEGPEITVRVTYAYPCTVPVARSILCSTLRDLASSELRSSLAPWVASLASGRFKQIQRETTALIQEAPYEYQRRSES